MNSFHQGSVFKKLCKFYDYLIQKNLNMFEVKDLNGRSYSIT